MRIILGTQSPRRQEIFKIFSLPFTQVPSHFPEESIQFKGDPQRYVIEISEGKAKDLSKKFPNDLIITADTEVFLDHQIFGKPSTLKQAKEFLKKLSGREHTVYTAVTLMKDEALFSSVDKTLVTFNLLTDSQIETYLSKQSFLDRAGGYTVEKQGSLLIKKIEGCFYNLMGLPINTLYDLLLKFDLDLWDYL